MRAGAAAGRRSRPPLLIDCLALWLTDAMDRVGAWDDAKWAADGQRALRERVAELVEAVRATRRTVVAVSNEVGSGVVPATVSGRRFRDELGRLNAAFAGECEQVLLVVAGQATVVARVSAAFRGPAPGPALRAPEGLEPPGGAPGPAASPARSPRARAGPRGARTADGSSVTVPVLFGE